MTTESQHSHEAFLYCWTDFSLNKLYVGIHKGSVDDGYVCSSKIMLEEYKKRPSDFSRKVLAIGSMKDIVKLESTILKTGNAAKDPIYYNQHNGDGKFFCKKHTSETKEKIKEKLLNHKRSESHRLSISNAKKGKTPSCVFSRRSYSGENNPNFGKSNKNIHLKKFDIEGNVFYGAEEIVKHFNLDSVDRVYYRVCCKSEKWKDWKEFGTIKNYVKKQKVKRPDLTLRNLTNNPSKRKNKNGN